jgi:hypothetical protein
MRKTLVLLALALLLVPSAGLSPVAADSPESSYFRVRTTTLEDGTVLAETLINGPPDPPPGSVRATSKAPVPSAAEDVNVLSNVPAFNWSFGCSATSAAMIAGYYDRTGYADIYTGPTNGGLMPLNNSAWRDWYDGIDWRHQCPLSATHLGLDGRASEGHVDDYWVVYGHAGPDPLGADGLEHTYGDCTGDYMKTNQSAYGNVDGGTTFWNYNDGSPLHCSAMPGHGIDNDGGYGLKQFYESRGYSVTNCYNQYIRGQGTNPLLGFTYDQYKAEIDAGRPVMIHVQGHTMVGIGYDDAANLMYIHDTWDYNVHAMTWGGIYSTMQHYGVTIVQPDAISTPPAAPSDLIAAAAGAGQIDLTWTDNADDEAGFKIERSPDASAWAPLDTVGADVTSYQDTGLEASTTYYYRVYAYNAAGSSAYSNEASATSQAQGSEDVASADYATTYGSVVGTYVATHTQDDSYQSITEVHSGGKPSKRYDRLEHIWRFDLSGGNHVFNVDAYYDDADADELDTGFAFYSSTSPEGPWTPLLTVVKTEDNDIYQAADLDSVSGTIYIRVIDNDRSEGNVSYDTLHVDHMYIDGGAPPTEPPEPATGPDPAHGASNVTTTPALSWSAGARAESHDVYFGTSSGLEFQGNQAGTSFSPGELQLNTTYYWRIDEVNSVGTTTGAVWSFTTRASGGLDTMHVDSIVLDTVKGDKGTVHGRATVTVVDEWGGLVAEAAVTGTFTGSYNESPTDTTDASGTAALTTTGATKKPAFEFCVSGITHAALTYAPGDNVMTCASYP